MSRRAATTGLVLRHFSAGRGPAALVALLLCLLAALVTAAPVAAGAMQSATVRDQLSRISPNEADVTAVAQGVPYSEPFAAGRAAPAEEIWGPFDGALAQFRSAAPAPLPELLAPAQRFARSQEIWLDYPPGQDPPDARHRITVGFDPDFTDRAHLVAGDWPAAVDFTADSAGITGVDALDFAMSAETAERMHWEVGQTRTAWGQPGERLNSWRLSGIWEADDPADPYWQHVRSVLDPFIIDDGNAPPLITGTGIADPSALAAVWALPGRLETTAWYPLDTAGVADGDAAAIEAALRKFSATARPVEGSPGGAQGIASLRLRTDAADTIGAALAQSRATQAILAMIASGPLGVGVLVILLACRLIVERRRAVLRLLSARGASVPQVTGVLAAEGLLLGVLPAAAGVALVLLLTRAEPAPALLIAPALVALVPAAILGVLARGAMEGAGRADLGRGGRLRAVVEGALLVLAAVAVGLLFTRGYTLSGVDPLLAITPLLVALAGALLTLRLYPLPLSAMLRRARRGPGLGAFLGSARALREPALGLIPVLALLVGVAVATSSGVLLSTLQSGIRSSAAGQAGADVRITSVLFGAADVEEVRATPGVASAAAVSGAQPVEIEIDGQSRRASLHVADEHLREVQGDGPGILPAGADLAQLVDGRIPVVVSGALGADIGDAEVEISGVPVTVVGVASAQTPLNSRQNWIIADASHTDELDGTDGVSRLVLVRAAEGVDPAVVRTELRDRLPTARIDTVGDLVAQLESGPAAVALRAALIAATAGGAVLGALAVLLTLALAGPHRQRLASLLQALGAPRRAGRALRAWEIVPPALAALAGGLAVGAVLPVLVLAAVDLRPFTGSPVAPPYTIDALVLVLSLGGFTVLAAALTAVADAVTRRSSAAAVLSTTAAG